MYRELFSVCVTLTTYAFIIGCSTAEFPQTNARPPSTSTNNEASFRTPPFDPAQSTYLLSSGDEIQVMWPNGPITCSVAYISNATGLTAGHCGAEGAEVYSHGTRIGTVSTNYLLDGLGLDIAEIALLPGLQNELEPLRIGNQLQGSVVFTHGPEGEKRRGILLSEEYTCQRFKINDQPVFAYVQSSNLRLSPGDSGAPIYSVTGELVALGQGGNGGNESTVTPLKLLESAKTSGLRELNEQAGGSCRG